MNYRPLARTSDFVEQASGEDTLIYDLKSNKAICLNESAAIVWKLCDGKRTVSDIAVEVGKQMKSSVNEDFVLLALDQLNSDGLLAEGFEQEARFIGLSRREIIRKIGIGSLVALPIVSSILAPNAIAAQSACGTPIGVCIPTGGVVCSPGCNGSTLNFTVYSDTGCMTVLTPSSFTCPAGTVTSGNPGLIVNSIT